MNRYFLLSLIIAASISMGCAADDDSILYFCAEENATDEHAEIDRQIRAVFSSDFRIVDIPDDKNHVAPQPIAGRLPRTALSESGEQLEGSVWVAYVVTTDGLVAEPRVLKTADPRLNSAALKAMAGWRFAPAQLKGVAIPYATASPFSFEIEEAPTEFVTQILEPTGGKILRPKEWFYSEGHDARSYVWTISREDSSGNKPYRTGIRVQAIVGVKAATGKTAKQFILDFVASKKDEATKVRKVCKEKDVGLFTRICLETEEGRNHILYSLFWGSGETDVAVIRIAGTTNELWETYSPTFDRMGEFELVDMKRFEK